MTEAYLIIYFVKYCAAVCRCVTLHDLSKGAIAGKSGAGAGKAYMHQHSSMHIILTF
jgi:hypothetical protein